MSSIALSNWERYDDCLCRTFQYLIKLTTTVSRSVSKINGAVFKDTAINTKMRSFMYYNTKTIRLCSRYI